MDASWRRRAITTWMTMLVLALLAGCTEPGPLEVSSEQESIIESMTKKHPTQEVPFEAEMSWLVGPPQMAPGFPLGTDTFDGRCSVPSTWVLSYGVSGNASHLGRLDGGGSHCAIVEFDAQLNPVGGTGSDARLVLAAANGDELHLDGTGGSSGVLDSGVPWFSYQWQVSSGTGRFLGAEGEGTLYGLFLGFGERSPVTMEGWLRYDASRRSQR